MENIELKGSEYLCIRLNLQNIKEKPGSIGVPEDIEKRKDYELICVDRGMAYLKRIKKE